jgi:uncharacterized repeat protein (TIGR03803 family)
VYSRRRLTTCHWTRVFAAALGILFGAVMGGNAFAWDNEKVLHSFSGPPDGIFPLTELVADSAGNLFGTASQSGVPHPPTVPPGGTIFKISPDGAFTLLYSFTGGSDGSNPGGTLYIDKEGNLFGTTGLGGKAGCGSPGQGCGVVFKLSPSGAYSVLYTFSGGNDGASPAGSLLADKEGNLYGTTQQGGASGSGCGGFGCGVVFKLSQGGGLTVLHSFSGSDGAFPSSGVIMCRNGNLCGTTRKGGTGCRLDTSGCGTVFELSPKGNLKVLYSFSGSDGFLPNALYRDSKGDLYGTTLAGGPRCSLNTLGCGEVFELSPEKSLTIRHMFKDREGAAPYGGLIADNEGNLYGTTNAGGDQGCTGLYGCGTVFRLSTDWKYTILHAFAGAPTEGGAPEAGLIADGKGNLYGTTTIGGTADDGTIINLTVTGFVP